jgi:hypothetical protein
VPHLKSQKGAPVRGFAQVVAHQGVQPLFTHFQFGAGRGRNSPNLLAEREATAEGAPWDCSGRRGYCEVTSRT